MEENKAMSVDGRKALTTRDQDGLMLDQRRYLATLAENKTRTRRRRPAASARAARSGGCERGQRKRDQAVPGPWR